MWNADKRCLDQALRADLPDWDFCSVSLHDQVLDWILEDRRTPKKKQVGRAKQEPTDEQR